MIDFLNLLNENDINVANILFILDEWINNGSSCLNWMYRTY